MGNLRVEFTGTYADAMPGSGAAPKPITTGDSASKPTPSRCQEAFLCVRRLDRLPSPQPNGREATEATGQGEESSLDRKQLVQINLRLAAVLGPTLLLGLDLVEDGSWQPRQGYGLGIFLGTFFLKRVGATAVFFAALLADLFILPALLQLFAKPLPPRATA